MLVLLLAVKATVFLMTNIICITKTLEIRRQKLILVFSAAVLF